jgi:hypothetical protein
VVNEGDEIKIGPWTYKVCKIKQQTDNAVLVNAVPINKEVGE